MAPSDNSSSDTPATGGLQLPEDMAFQRKSWRVERIGWAAMALLLVAALLGLFSAGPLSKGTAQDPAGLVQIAYDRFQRYLAPGTLRVTVTKPADQEPPATGGEVSLRFGRSLADAVSIERIEPQPDRTATTADALVFTFRIQPPGRSGTISFTVKPGTFGPIRGEIGLVGHEPALLTPFVYP